MCQSWFPGTGEMLEMFRWFVRFSDSFAVRRHVCALLLRLSILVDLKILEGWEQVAYLTGTHRKRLWSCLGSNNRRREDRHRGVFNRSSPRSRGLDSPGAFWGQRPPRIAACSGSLHMQLEDCGSVHFWLALLSWEFPWHQWRPQAWQQKDTPALS